MRYGCLFPLVGHWVDLPNRSDVQIDALRQTLGLVNQPNGPVLIDYPNTVEDDIQPEEGWSCPMVFPDIQPETESGAQKAQLRTEVQFLRPWFDEGVRKQGRTTVGTSGKGADWIGEMLEMLATFSANAEMAIPNGYSHPMPELLRYLSADIRAFCSEEAISKPAPTLPTPEDLEEWFFLETVAGDVIYEIRERLLRADMLVLMAQGLDNDEIDNRLVLNPGAATEISGEAPRKPGINRKLLQESAEAFQAGLIGRFTWSFVPIAMRDRRGHRTKTTANS